MLETASKAVQIHGILKGPTADISRTKPLLHARSTKRLATLDDDPLLTASESEEEIPPMLQ